MLTVLDRNDAENLTISHMLIGKQIIDFVDDMGEDRGVIISLDDVDNPEDSEFVVLFTGTDLFLHYTYDGIYVERMAEDDSDEDEVLKLFPLERIHEATHWLLTQAK